MRSSISFSLFLLVACQPGHLSTTAGDFGVVFSESPDCIEIDVSRVGLEAPFTVDIFLHAGDAPEYALYPMVVWPGAFALFEDRNGYLIFGPSSDTSPGSGASTPTQILDGGYHHVAGVFTEDGQATLYLDGSRMVYAPTALLEDPGDVVYLGCWPGMDDAVFQGTLGEIRIQSTQHYDGDFAPTWEKYEYTDTTVALWHLDEGRGTAILDEGGLADGDLTSGEWVPFPLPGYDPDEGPSDTGE
jgi:hypothetical protein